MFCLKDFHASVSPTEKSCDNVEILITGEEYQNQDRDEVFEDTSFEGVGRGGNSYQLSTNLESELQNKVSQLEFLLTKVREEKKELELSLEVSEETEEELRSHRRLNLSSNVTKENEQLVQELEEKSCNLQLQLDFLENDLKAKEDRLEDNEVLMVSLRSEAAEAKEKEAAALAVVEKLREKAEKTETLLRKKEEEIAREIVARELLEEKFEESRMTVNRLQQTLSMKEEDLKSLTESLGGNVGTCTTINDISLDEKAIEAQLTPGRVKVREPSCNSTPTKPALGSIAEELLNLQQLGERECLPSPLCEKRGSQVSLALDRMLENIRAAVRAQTETNNRKELLAAVGREVLSVKQVLESFLNDLPTVEDYNSLREKRDELETELSEANLFIEGLRLKNFNNNVELEEEEEEDEQVLEEVSNMSIKVGAVADLLKTANSVLMAHTEDTDFSLEPDTADVSGWQLDLDGIQLVEQRQLRQQRLFHYSKQGGLRSAFPTELSRSPVPGGNNSRLLWQRLHSRLEDLQKTSEMSRDLLLLAGEKLRARQVSTAQVQTEEENIINSSTITTSPWGQSKQARLGSRMRTFFRSVFSTVFLYLIFTFFCGLKIDQDTYYPVTWYYLRWVT